MIPERKYSLPRLPREFYQAGAVVHWTCSTFDRAQGWLNQSFHRYFRELMLHVAAREKLLCPVYCLMPDHIHLIWMGLTLESDQLNAMAFLRTHLEPGLAPAKFQPQAHDHVLSELERKRNAFSQSCFYLLNNPVAAELVTATEQWQYHGAVIAGYPTLHPLRQNFWPLFWRLYQKMKQPDADRRTLPPRRIRS